MVGAASICALLLSALLSHITGRRSVNPNAYQSALYGRGCLQLLVGGGHGVMCFAPNTVCVAIAQDRTESLHVALRRLDCKKCSQSPQREQQRSIVRVGPSLAQAQRGSIVVVCRLLWTAAGPAAISYRAYSQGLVKLCVLPLVAMAGVVEEMCRRFAKASLVDKEGRRNIGMLCELLKSFLRRKALELIETAGGRPILLSYSSDGTPLTTRERLRLRLNGTAAPVVRVGGSSQEYLIQQVFVRRLDVDGNSRTEVVLREPLPFTSGKAAWAVFAAGRDFFPTLRSAGHGGIAIQHFAFDRALHKPLVRLFSQHCALHSTAGARGELGNFDAALQELTCWVVHSACANHDCHNALKRGLFNAFQDAELLKDIYISIESLRNSYGLLHDNLAAWVQETLAFVEEPEPADNLQQLYTAMGVEPEWVATISEMGLLFRNGRLEVSAAQMNKPTLFDDLCTCLLYLWRFVRFSDSRWCTVGLSCRVLTVALLTGVSSLVERLLADKKVSNFNIGGFQKLAKDARFFVVLASICSYPADSVFGELLDDGRVARRLDTLEATLACEMRFVCNLPDETWSLLATAAGVHMQVLRGEAIAAAHVSVAFISSKVFCEARRGAWGLVQGCVDANLAALHQQDGSPDDDTLWKIKELMGLGFNVEQLKEALALVRDISWSTTSVEQQHGSASVIMKLHDTFSRESMCSRALLHAMRQFFSPAVEEQELAALRRKVQALGNTLRRLTSFGGRQFFLKDLVQTGATRLAKGQSEMPSDWRQKIMQRHASQWKDLDPRLRAKYEARAAAEREARGRLENEALESAQTALALEEARQAGLKPEGSRKFVLSQCRFTDRDRRELDEPWATDRLGRRQLQEARAGAMVAPPPPPQEIQEAMSSVVLRGRQRHERPFWLATLCQHRAVFANTALVVILDGGGQLVLKLSYALQSPLLCSLLADGARRGAFPGSADDLGDLQRDGRRCLVA